MSDTNNSDQTVEIMQELMQAERDQEVSQRIIQTTTIQGQIVALVLILKDLGVLSKDDVNKWETMCEHATELLVKWARYNELCKSDQKEVTEGTLTTAIDGLQAAVELTQMMGSEEGVLRPLLQLLEELLQSREDLRHAH